MEARLKEDIMLEARRYFFGATLYSLLTFRADLTVVLISYDESYFYVDVTDMVIRSL